MTMPNDHTAIAERLEERFQFDASDTAHGVMALITAYRASADEVERAQKVQDALVAKFESLLKNAADNHEAALARAAQAEAGLASARKALEPFARAMAEYGDDPAEADGANCWEHSLAMLVTIGDFRRAAEVYASLSGRTGSEAYTAADGPVRDEYSSCSSTQDQDGGGDV